MLQSDIERMQADPNFSLDSSDGVYIVFMIIGIIGYFPNINLLGKREPSIYGSVTFEDYLAELRKKYADVQIDYFQSNIEGELIDKIQQVGFDVDGIILNAGAYTHTSIALQD